jgi:hypothetical protein
MTIDKGEYALHEGNVNDLVVVSTIIYLNSNAFLRIESKIVKENHHITLMNKRQIIASSSSHSLNFHYHLTVSSKRMLFFIKIEIVIIIKLFHFVVYMKRFLLLKLIYMRNLIHLLLLMLFFQYV